MSEHDEKDILDESADILTLVDEDGVEHVFEIVDSADLNDQSYLALVPVYDDAEAILQDDGELVILKVTQDGDEEILEAIEDEQEFDRVGEFFMKRLEDVFDFEEDDSEKE